MVTLDETGTLWAIGILGLLLGIGLGTIATYALLSRNNRTHKLQRELNQLAERFTDYRDQVGMHFMHTSDLVKEMTRSYRAVYEHLATGAHHLCAEDPAAPTLSHHSAEQLAANNTGEVDPGSAEYDELEELTSLRKDIDTLMSEAPRISEVDVKAAGGKDTSVQH
jgi:uncharacterized membrane-anchored protein YhcB (DUF1043 family)